MTLNNRQFVLLNAMDIPLWASKNRVSNKNQVAPKSTADTQKVEQEQIKHERQPSQVAFNIDLLSKNKLFIDILLSMKLTISNVSLENNHLNLGTFIWQFNEINQVTFQQNTLSTPSLQTLAQSLTLKKELWQIIKSHIITSNKTPS